MTSNKKKYFQIIFGITTGSGLLYGIIVERDSWNCLRRDIEFTWGCLRRHMEFKMSKYSNALDYKECINISDQQSRVDCLRKLATKNVLKNI